MAELFAAGRYAPWEIPADAVVVLAWYSSDPTRTPHWRVVAMGSGFAAMTDVAQAVKDQFPDLSGQTVMIAQVGGNKSRVKSMAITTQVNRTLTETDPVAPAP